MSKFEQKTKESQQERCAHRNEKRRANQSSVTGRDGYIIAQALAYASEWLRTLDVYNDEPSNRHDMDKLLAEHFPSLASLMRHQARNKLRNRSVRSGEEWQTLMEQDAKETEEYLMAEASEWSEATVDGLATDDHCVQETA